MFRPFKALSAVILSTSVTLTTSGIAFAEAPSTTLTEADALGTYSTPARRINYSGELAEFSVDIPDGLSPAPSNSEAKEVGDGSTQWELFYGEDSTLYIDCCLHQKEGGYAGEMSVWRQSLEDGSLDLDIFGGSDLDGTEYSVVDLRYAYSENDGTEILIGEYPLDEDTWVNISVGGSTADMSGLREDICVMLGSFSRNAVSVPDKHNEIAVPAVEDPLGTYSVPAYRVVYNGDMAKFSIDVPEGYDMYGYFSDPLELGDGITLHELLQAQGGEWAATINLVEYENGFEGRKEYWQQYTDYEYYCEVSDADGIEFHIVGFIYESDNYAVETIDAEYPWNDSSYIEIGYILPSPVSVQNRTDIFDMLCSFSRNLETTGDTTVTAEIPENEDPDKNAETPAPNNPNTGAAAPVTAALASVGALVAMAVSAVKFKRK